MKNANILFIVIAVLMIMGISLIIWKSVDKSKYRNTAVKTILSSKKDNFQTTAEQLNKLKQDLLNLVNQKTGVDMTAIYNQYLDFNATDAVNQIKKAMTGKIPLNKFSMHGDTMDEPILKMYQEDPTLFDILSSSGLISFIGKIIATTTWVISSKNLSQTGLTKFWQCTLQINWNNIQIWMNLTGPGSPISLCIV